MVPNKRQDEHKLIAAMFLDIHKSHGTVFNTRSYKLTLNKLANRLSAEGIGFLTKTLPRLGKAFDKALSGGQQLNATKLGFKPQFGSELPLFCGEFFNRVLSPDGTVLQDPCADSVSILRNLLYLFYKYELPYTHEQEQQVIDKFERTEDDILARSVHLRALLVDTESSNQLRKNGYKPFYSQVEIVREARILLSRVFSNFDFTDIIPAHGPGAVATKQRLSEKFNWTNVSSRITNLYPLDAYFYASLGHVCDRLDTFTAVKDEDLPARVVLVPKDSRGPRLISCEPVDFQWIQQGIMRRLVSHIENIELTKYNVFFTDQKPNQRGALLGSSSGLYATLDLNEASDRVSLDLVRLLFPSHVCEYLEAVRSSSTVLPDGRTIKLNKFAPMGSALCFPILALTVWAILSASAPNADTRDSILVYGDDVIVPTAYAVNAMEQLESFGLKVNRDKSCISGFFRESCGMDAFQGIPVTPVRIRTVWSSTPSPESYVSWISYANSLYDKKYFECYDLIVGMLYHTYGKVPCDDMHLHVPCLREVPDYMRPKRYRHNTKLQKLEYYVYDTKALSEDHEIDGWSMLLRFFSESSGDIPFHRTLWFQQFMGEFEENSPLSVRSYTKRRASMLVRRWR